MKSLLNIVIKHPFYGIGKIISETYRYGRHYYLVYYFEENRNLHDGAAEGHVCEDHHGWWYTGEELKNIPVCSPLCLLIERRRHVFHR